MNVDVQVSRQSMDTAKLGGAAALLVLGLAAFYYLGESGKIVRLLALLAPIAAAIGLGLATASGRNLMGMARETQIEVRKVVWPSRQETVQTTGFIIAIVMVTALFLWILDLMLGGFTRWLLGQGG